MSWINDVKHDLSKLDVSKKNLKNFGITVGSVFLVLFAWFFYKDIFIVFRLILLISGLILLITGIIKPGILKSAFKIWMGLAFVLGWLVSRIILTILFFLVLLPVGLIAKIFGKKFIDTGIKENSNSYWIRKEKSKINYEKMF